MGAPREEVDFAEGAAPSALLIAEALLSEADRARELEGVGEALGDALELLAAKLLFSAPRARRSHRFLLGTHSPQGRRTHMGEGPVLRVVEGRESGREETPDVVERRRRVEVRAAQHDEVEV